LAVEINRDTSIVYDAINYPIMFFNPDNFRSAFKIYAEKETDLFENYHEFRKTSPPDPPKNLFPFFFFDGRVKTVITTYFDKNHVCYNHTTQSVLKIFKDTANLKRAIYYYYLEQFRENIDIELVIKGDVESTSHAAALLSAIHSDYPTQFYLLFFKFEELVEELISYLKQLIPKVNLFHVKRQSLYEEIINNFLKR